MFCGKPTVNAMKTIPGTTLAFTILLTATAGRADFLTYSDIEAVTPWNPVIPVGFNIPQFNPADGTLNSVNLTMSGYANSTFSYNFLGSGGITVWQDLELSVVYNGSDVLAQNEAFFLSPNYPTPVPLPGNGTMVWSSSLPQSQVTFSSALDLANFTGTGNVPLSGECYNVHTVNVTGAPAPGETTLVNSSHLIAVVTYDFTPVPEPGAIGLTCLSGLMFAFRKRR